VFVFVDRSLLSERHESHAVAQDAALKGCLKPPEKNCSMGSGKLRVSMCRMLSYAVA